MRILWPHDEPGGLRRCHVSKKFCWLLAGLALVCVAGSAELHAELTWKEQTVEIAADPGATVLEAHFHFSNAGTSAVDVTDIHTSCGCTTADLEKRHYEPGEGGEIVARYTVDERIGLQKKMVLVSTNGQAEATTLTLLVRLPEVLHFPETFVTWKQGEDAKEKVLPIKVAPNTPKLENLVVQPSNGSVTATIRPAGQGTGYELHVTPISTERPMFTTLLVRCRVGAAEKSARAYATVERAEPDRSAKSHAAGPLPSRPDASPSAQAN